MTFWHTTMRDVGGSFTLRQWKAAQAALDARGCPITEALKRLLCRETLVRMAMGDMDDDDA